MLLIHQILGISPFSSNAEFKFFAIINKRSMADEIKVFSITGQAAKDYSGGMKKKRATRKKSSEELIPVLEVPQVQSVASAPVMIQREQAPPEPVRQQIKEKEDDKKIKVELKKKHTEKKVQLHQKKDEPKKKTETRKKPRKVLLGISSLHKRMTRAKKMQKVAKEMPIDKLKAELIKKNLIKMTSKAPESVLRQIAADAQIVEGKAL